MSSQPTRHYYTPQGGLPAQSELVTDRAVFTDAYMVMPRRELSSIVTSLLPYWEKARAWVLARPLSGFAETFSQYIMELDPGGYSLKPELDPAAQGVFFVLDGELTLTIDTNSHQLRAGSFAYLPAGCLYKVENKGDRSCHFHWIRKRYEPVVGLDRPEPIITHDGLVEPEAMADTEGRWATTLFVDPTDLRHDMAVTIVTLKPGAVIPFPETHVMEHGLYVLQGKAVYRLNQDWVEVEAGDFMWLRAFCPQACYAGGPEDFRYLLYKDVNRHAKLTGF